MAYTHRQWSPRRRLSPLDCILGPKSIGVIRTSATKKKCASLWDHYPICAVAQEEDEEGWRSLKRRKKKWTGWQPHDDEQEEKIKKMVMQMGDEKSVKSFPRSRKT